MVSPNIIHDTELIKQDGYFVARGLFSKEEIIRLRNAFMAEAKNGPVVGLSDILPNSHPNDPLSKYPRMIHPHRHQETQCGMLAMQYMIDERLYPILRELVGDEPLAVQSMFYFKPPGARGQELHQDNYYLRVKPGTCMAAWIAVDDATPSNGGMKVVPGSHTLDITCPEKANETTSFTSDLVREPLGMSAKHVNLKAGDVLFFNGSLIHGSTLNTSKRRFRRSLIFHYVPKQSNEMSNWYQDPISFEGERFDIPEAVGGGPCGTSHAAGIH